VEKAAFAEDVGVGDKSLIQNMQWEEPPGVTIGGFLECASHRWIPGKENITSVEFRHQQAYGSRLTDP